ncbi:hypothetical protein LINPERPRIM_LOCUS20213 [Linum perenne]
MSALQMMGEEEKIKIWREVIYGETIEIWLWKWFNCISSALD